MIYLSSWQFLLSQIDQTTGLASTRRDALSDAQSETRQEATAAADRDLQGFSDGSEFANLPSVVLKSDEAFGPAPPRQAKIR